MTPQQEIEALIAEVALKNHAAFQALYARSSAKLFGIVLRVLKDQSLAEDALQDVYVKIWHNADKYRVNGLSPMTWMITIARNHAIDVLRRQRANAAPLTDTVVMADDQPGPEQRAIQSDEAGRLRTCLNALDPAHAQAVRGAYLDGETYADLANRQGVPLNTMRTWLRRGLLKLKECLTR